MKKFSILILFVFAINFNGISQDDLNSYRYVIIPEKFEFLSKPDLYQLNSLTKFLFNKYGFTAFMEGEELPEDLNTDRCKALTLDVTDEKGGIFKTKLQMHLKNCRNKVIASSKVGETREKQLDKAFNFALRDAFTTFQEANYLYQPEENMQLNNDTDDSLSKDIDTIPSTSQNQSEVKVVEGTIEKSRDSSIEETNQPNEVPSVVVTGMPDMQTDDETTVDELSNSTKLEILYAQPLENGFQVVDTTPKKIMFLFKTEIDGVFMVKGKDAIVYNKNGKWFYSEMNGSLKIEEINIKF